MRSVLIASVLLLSACTPAVTVPRQPFDDIPVPREWTRYSLESVITTTPQATSAKLLYFSQSGVDESLDQARQLLLGEGWKQTKSERFVNREGFPGVWAEFAKAEDVTRVTAVEGAHATHVEYAIARVTRSP
ncbi:MAG TPA: hypothetical protein VEL75_03380 [Candidatus Methylomirabilis sp.]|nr:hypothetical protein [Candidatus Methylomirabilis sp.]